MAEHMSHLYISGDKEHDTESAVFLLNHLADAYLDFDVCPDVDEVSEVSSWAHCVMRFGSILEDTYGRSTTRDIFDRAWEVVKS